MKEKDRRKTILKDKLYDIEVHDGLPSWEEFAHNRSVIYEKRRNSVTRRKLVLITRYAAAFLLLSGFVFGIYKINSFKIKDNPSAYPSSPVITLLDSVKLPVDSIRALSNETSNGKEQNIAINSSKEFAIVPETVSNNYPETKTNIVAVADKNEISNNAFTDIDDIKTPVNTYPLLEAIDIEPYKVQHQNNILIKTRKESVLNFQNSYSSDTFNESEYRNKWDYKFSTDIQIINKYSFINNQSSDNYIPKPPLTVNIGFFRNLGNRITIGSGIGYESLRSTYLEYGITTVTQKSVVAHYIGIPVILSYYFTGNQIGPNIYITGNINAEKLIHANSIDVIKYPSNMGGNIITKYLDHDGIMLSSSLGTGIEYNFTHRFGLFAEPYLNYYFYIKDQPLSVRTRAPLSINIRFGAKF